MAEETATKVANTKQMIALAKAFNQSKSRVASINGEIGERIAKAVENGNLHAKAFKFNCGLARMFEKDDLKAREFWRNVILYYEEFEKAGLFGEQHVADIVDLAERRGQEDGDAARAAENEKRILDGIKPLSDEEPALREYADDLQHAASDAEFNDSTSSKPSRRNQKTNGGVGDADGSYKLH